MESKAAAPLVLALLLGGCPKRQTVPRVVYIQPPPASGGAGSKQAEGTNPIPQSPNVSNQANSTAGPTEALIIEEPPPPPPPQPVAAQALPPVTADAAPPKRRARPRTESHDTEEQTEPTDSVAPASPVEVPSLEPRPEPGHDQGTQDQLQAQVDGIKRRITDLEKNSDLSTAEQRTLTDANSFWSQSVAALQDHDLLRARELAQKASLLLTALERR